MRQKLNEKYQNLININQWIYLTTYIKDPQAFYSFSQKQNRYLKDYQGKYQNYRYSSKGSSHYEIRGLHS